jgi:hypothetical protein
MNLLSARLIDTPFRLTWRVPAMDLREGTGDGRKVKRPSSAHASTWLPAPPLPALVAAVTAIGARDKRSRAERALDVVRVLLGDRRLPTRSEVTVLLVSMFRTS